MNKQEAFTYKIVTQYCAGWTGQKNWKVLQSTLIKKEVFKQSKIVKNNRIKYRVIARLAKWKQIFKMIKNPQLWRFSKSIQLNKTISKSRSSTWCPIFYHRTIAFFTIHQSNIKMSTFRIINKNKTIFIYKDKMSKIIITSTKTKTSHLT